MFGLPVHTEVGTQLPKKSIYAKFAMNSSEKDKFDADISRIVIANAVDGRHVAEGEKVKSFYVLAVQLKHKEYDPKNIVSLVKLINQNILFALTYESEVQLAVYCTRLVTSNWQPTEEVSILLNGLNLDAVWDNIVASIGEIMITDGKSVAEQIVEDDAHAKLMKQIEQLEQKARTEKQPRKKLELFEKLKELKKKL